MDTLTTISILKNQIKEFNNGIFEYVQNVVCPKISPSGDKINWKYLNLSKDCLWITAINPDMSQVPGGTIAIEFKNGTWFFRNTFGNTFTGVGPDAPYQNKFLIIIMQCLCCFITVKIMRL